jgi:demethylmenaquinone methyltransferase/2-methoxy-6-polyprenyl-1,4-benzoquinol methylase
MTRPAPTSSKPIWTERELAGDPHQRDDKADRVRRMFGAIARRYDLNNRLHSFGRDQAWRRCGVQLAGAGGGDNVLDVACGTGDLAEAFCRTRPASVTGLDFAEPMLELARAKASRRRRRGDEPTPDYVGGDAMALPFEDGRFDVVSIAFGIRNVTRPDQALREFRRVLRPGGRLLILEFGEPALAPLRWANNLYTRRVMPLTATIIAGDRTGAYRYLPRSIETFLDRDALAKRLHATGFEDVRQRSMTFGVCVATVGRAGCR